MKEGWKVEICGGGEVLVFGSRKKEMDKGRSDSKVTMDIVQQIANSVNPMIKLTVETPCNFKNGKLPVLDIKVKINENEMNRIDFEHYEKPTKNPRVILASSALSFNKKRTILIEAVKEHKKGTWSRGPDKIFKSFHVNLEEIWIQPKVQTINFGQCFEGLPKNGGRRQIRCKTYVQKQRVEC